MSKIKEFKRKLRWIPQMLKDWRWKNKFKECGEELHVFGRIFVPKPKNVSIGKRCNLNDGIRLICAGNSKIIIGDDVTLSPGATVISTGYNLEIWNRESKRYHFDGITEIGNNVWLCTNATVCPNVKISGHHVVIGSGGVVVTNITDNNCLYVGIPAKKKKHYDIDGLSI